MALDVMSLPKKPKKMNVGIVQNAIIAGGRLAVLVRIIKILNQRGVVPDIITYRMPLSAQDLKRCYGMQVTYRLRPLNSFLACLPQEANVVAFGLALRKICRQYDYFIDSNNTSFLMPRQTPTLSYVHFPRKARVTSKLVSIHHPEGALKRWTNPHDALNKALGIGYDLHAIAASNIIVANSAFSRRRFRKCYPTYARPIPIIYPPVDTHNVTTTRSPLREQSVCSVGRFCAAKDQLGQIRLARKLPQWHFHLIGFAQADSPYLNICRSYVAKHRLSNVTLHINVSERQKQALFNQAMCFIHTNINEPFGITTVEAILRGCLPLVHDSGGQKEIVPFSELRFNSWQDLYDRFKHLDAHAGNGFHLIDKLKTHCLQWFASNQFDRRFNQALDEFEQRCVASRGRIKISRP
jgi:hypothetical protein